MEHTQATDGPPGARRDGGRPPPGPGTAAAALETVWGGARGLVGLGRLPGGARRRVLGEVARQVWFGGVLAVPLVAAAALVVAMVTAWMVYPPLSDLGARVAVVRLFDRVVLTEVGPLFAAGALAARSAPAIAAELAAMRASWETDALVAHGVPPDVWIRLPRLAGSVLSAVSLSVVVVVVSYLGAGGALWLGGAPRAEVLALLDGLGDAPRLLACCAKAAVYGLGVGAVATGLGLSGRRDPTAAPRRASAAVGAALLPVLVVDVLLAFDA